MLWARTVGRGSRARSGRRKQTVDAVQQRCVCGVSVAMAAAAVRRDGSDVWLLLSTESGVVAVKEARPAVVRGILWYSRGT